MIKIAPSILSADFSRLGDEIRKADEAGADYIHIDVMDGIFVPNITLGSPIVKSIRKCTNKAFDVHLMTENPENQVRSFAEAGADVITVHVEAAHHLHRVIRDIRAHGAKAGIALNPATPALFVEPLIEEIDLILIMTVNPGFGGQKFIRSTLSKIGRVRDMIEKSGRKIELEADGGINEDTAKDVAKAGADVLVAGSFVYESKDASKAVKILRDLAEEGAKERADAL